jgi:hypothetical protein
VQLRLSPVGTSRQQVIAYLRTSNGEFGRVSNGAVGFHRGLSLFRQVVCLEDLVAPHVYGWVFLSHRPNDFVTERFPSRARAPIEAPSPFLHYKDAILDRLAEKANVAQFVSFNPSLEQRYTRIYGFEVNCKFATSKEAVAATLAQASEHSVNIRSFDPASPKSKEFVYGIKDAAEAEGHITRLASEGLYTIVNETIDKCDGCVSGVTLGHIIEFAPCDTPRAVEVSGTVALPRRALGEDFLAGYSPLVAGEMQVISA